MTLRMLILFFISYTGICNAQSEPGRHVFDSLACIESLSVPRYIPIARQARLTGMIEARILIGIDGTTTRTITGNVHELLLEIVRKSLASSKFHTRCRNVEVKLLFDFQIKGEPTSATNYDVISFSYPNRFTVIAQPSITNVD